MAEWISVEEKLPKQNILVEFKGPEQGGGYKPQELGYYQGDSWISQVDAITFDLEEITHWMPLPEPPKETTND